MIWQLIGLGVVSLVLAGIMLLSGVAWFAVRILRHGTKTLLMFVFLMESFLALLLCVWVVAFAHAHDHGAGSWINRGGYVNPINKWPCCDERDCFPVIGVQGVTLPAPGYRMPSGEFVEEKQTLLSEDGQFWRCGSGGRTRCLFVPRPRIM